MNNSEIRVIKYLNITPDAKVSFTDLILFTRVNKTLLAKALKSLQHSNLINRDIDSRKYSITKKGIKALSLLNDIHVKSNELEQLIKS